MSIYLPLSMLVLIATGWLKQLPAELGITKTKIIFWLSIICCLTLLPTISITSELEINLCYLALLIVCVYLLCRIPVSRLFTIFSLQLMLGSLMFLYYEVFRIQLESGLQWFIILLSLVEGLIASKALGERICLVFGGFTFAQLGIIFLYHDRLSPIVFPDNQFLDTLWFTLVSLTLLHYLLTSLPVWSKSWRFTIWTRRR